MTLAQLQDELYDLLQPLFPSGLVVVWAKQSAPRPEKPYATLDFLVLGQRIGKDELREVVGGWETQGTREFVLSVNVFGDAAIDALTQFQLGLSSPEAVDAFEAAGFASVSESDIRDLTAKVDQRWEQRGQIDVTLRRTVARDEDLGYFDHVEINGETVNGG